MRRASRRTAFTIVELLVVITVIVVLLALLTPALDRAIYQAELAVCASHQKGIATGVSVYAMDHKRAYPYRRGVHKGNWKANKLKDGEAATGWGGTDDRQALLDYMNVGEQMQCPLNGPGIDIMTADPSTNVFGSYQLYYGWAFDGEKGMFRFGDRWTFDTERLNLISVDRDAIDLGAGWAFGTHPDADGVMYHQIRENAPLAPGTPDAVGEVQGSNVSFARWQQHQTWQRSAIDMNAAFDDGSVMRFNRLELADDGEPAEGMTMVPDWSQRTGWPQLRAFVPEGQ